MSGSGRSVWSWISRLLPPGLDGDARVQAQFFVNGWVVTIGIAAVSSLVYLATHTYSQAVAAAIPLCTGLAVLTAYRRGVAFVPLAHLSVASGVLCLGLGAVSTRPADYTTLAMMLLVPVVAAFLLSRQGVVAWLIITIAVAITDIVAIDHGWVMPFPDPAPLVSHLVNFSLGLVLMWLLVGAFHRSRMQALQRMRQAERSRRAFLANISHEIRTPMNGVLGMTEVLLLEPLPASQREQLQVIQRSGRALVALINDLLDLTKMEAGKLSLEQRSFNLATVLSDAQALVAPAAETKGLQLTVQRAAEVPNQLLGDGLRLGQVLGNLMANAVKFTHRGTVSLRVETVEDAPGRLRFSVRDTGIGMSDEVIARLFGAFEQGDASTTRRYGGTGLGLALSQQLVGLMGGTIEVQSQRDVGSTFSFDLPLQAASADAALADHPSAANTSPLGPVLVVDDNVINLKVASGLLEKAGVRCEVASSGRAALEAIRRGGFSLVLMDCQMPEMDGFEATERIRALEGPVAKTPIVALTASAMPDEVAACRRAGMNAVLTKPVSFAQLQAVLRSLRD